MGTATGLAGGDTAGDTERGARLVINVYQNLDTLFPNSFIDFKAVDDIFCATANWISESTLSCSNWINPLKFILM